MFTDTVSSCNFSLFTSFEIPKQFFFNLLLFFLISFSIFFLCFWFIILLGFFAWFQQASNHVILLQKLCFPFPQGIHLHAVKVWQIVILSFDSIISDWKSCQTSTCIMSTKDTVRTPCKIARKLQLSIIKVFFVSFSWMYFERQFSVSLLLGMFSFFNSCATWWSD